MGTTYHVKWVSDSGDSEQELAAGVLAQLQLVDRLMSTYKPESELSRFNQSEPGNWFDFSPQTFEVFQIAQGVSDISGGAFDITVGKLVNLWGFGPDLRPIKIPDDALLSSGLSKVGYQHLKYQAEGDKVLKETAMYVDLSAVAKGYSVDLAAKYLESQGVTDYLVEVGGEVMLSGHKPDGQPWRIAIESPIVGERRTQNVLEMDRGAVATSGDYRNYFEEDGVRYSHTIDPRTGKPIGHNLASVTVIDDTVARADALATSFMVMGPEQGMDVAVNNDIAVLFIVRRDGKFVEETSPAFLKRIKRLEE
ncbi:Membrane-associated lipoprotein involved in thiamine biosynthesis [Hahella chejuensis KCTC 2396]|uniref:FAD:protein FMN transferase n=1 Tax=Hahella chejuensis (strain KCTC 2396) TaxID=349521 RepID=Q2SIP5_HAHCH|nr:FAD:protein FMN transferase [Hahella chejuensis]ABC29479.1 Membrane-associated lipoprotein involved in thiamine biosynthesis [Hahella chejuensis KCTC 2396]